MLGSHGDAWTAAIGQVKNNNLGDFDYLTGIVQSMRRAVQSDLLITVEQLVDAETFGDLLEQAEHLQGQNYHVAAAVLGRAVLEEHLRKMCDREGLMPTKQNPTISDYNMALYNASPKRIDRVKMQHITTMAAIGNDAAHGKTVKQEDVERLLRDVRTFITYHS